MRQQYLAALVRRVEHAEQDPSAVVDVGAVADAERLVAAVKTDEVDLEAFHTLGWFHWYRAVYLSDEAEMNVACDYFGVCFALAEAAVPEHLFDAVAETAVELVQGWTGQAQQDPDLVPLAHSGWTRLAESLGVNHPLRPAVLSGLSVTWYLRYRTAGAPADLDEAVVVAEQALHATPPDEPQLYLLVNLASFLSKRFELRGQGTDLDRAITLAHRAAELVSPGDPTRGQVLANLCMTLRNRYGLTGDLRDLDAAIDHGRAAAAGLADRIERAGVLVNLCVVLRNRFERLGVAADVVEAQEAGEAAVTTLSEGHPDRYLALHCLAAVFKVRFEVFGEADILDRAVEAARAAAATCPPTNPERPAVVDNLAVMLHTRANRTGDLDELDEAIATLRDLVVGGLPDVAVPHKRTYNLSGFLRRRYERTGDRGALDEAITWARETASRLPPGHPDQSMVLSNLCACLSERFERDGTRHDLDEAITVGRQSVATTPLDHPRRAAQLTVLADSLVNRFRLTGSAADLDEAISADLAAVRASAEDSSLKVDCLTNLARHLSIKAKSTGDDRLTDQAITYRRAALAATPPEDASYAWSLVGVARALLNRNGTDDVEEARALVLTALERPVVSPSMWVQTAALAAALLDHDRAKAAEVLERAVLLLPETASRRLAQADQARALAAAAGLSSHAASLALSDGPRHGRSPAERALALLELGRGVMLGRTLDARDDLADLRTAHPDLAARFTDLRDRLDLRGDTEPDRHRAASELAAVTAHIRSLDGFAGFLRPPDVRDLVCHADRGPIVVLNVSNYRADAILVRPDGIEALPLVGLTFDHVRSQVITFLRAQATTVDPHASLRRRITAEDELMDLLSWLWDTVVGPVLDALGHLGPPEHDWPRVWWTPVGDLALMPLHAAGRHREPAGPRGRPTAMDRVVSSYTPTVRALAHARQRDAQPMGQMRSLIVAMPTTPGTDQPLPHARREAALLEPLLPGATTLVDPPPTRNAVLDHLTSSTVAHFACHSVTDPRNPARGRLLLNDHAEHPLTVADLMATRLDHARLAYLSACRTAVTAATDLLDEAIHLVTAFQLAGYPHVAGTLWEINDPIAADIAEAFYAHLTANGRPDPSRSAFALHQAVRAARDRLPLTPSLWAAHIHAGA